MIVCHKVGGDNGDGGNGERRRGDRIGAAVVVVIQWEDWKRRDLDIVGILGIFKEVTKRKGTSAGIVLYHLLLRDPWRPPFILMDDIIIITIIIILERR